MFSSKPSGCGLLCTGHCLSDSSFLAVALACGAVVAGVTSVFLTDTAVLGRYFGAFSTLAWLGVEERLNAKLRSLRVLAREHTKLPKKLNGGKRT